ncbi:ATP-binding protein, partial [Variovorax paradoxus]|uniref:sensor histidine kinase n=1 Tax=Variovorax paradoxus TaxID=34073 RepID=UPI00247A88ED
MKPNTHRHAGELRLVLRPFFAAQSRALRWGALLAAVTVLTGMALLGLSGWFITATALAGLHAATAFTFDVFAPSAGIRLLALGRSDTVAVAPAAFELAGLLREVAVDLLPQARAKRIDLGIQAPDDAAGHAHVELVAVADRALLREALTNLVANAIAYTPAEGTITVFAAGDAAGWSLNVEDDGPGLGEEERAQLGQRFRRGARAGKGGFGLGLA